jgi:hypothetical protein
MPLHHGLRAAAGASPADPYFSSTSLLLLGNGTNGGQNNTFVDGSTNNFTITRNGNTTQGSFSPFTGAGGSGYFDGSGDYLSVADNAAFDLPADFTVECWINLASTSNPFPRVFSFGTYNAANNLDCSIDTSTKYLVVYFNGTQYDSGTSTINFGTWYHIAIVRSGSTIKAYVDGTVKITISSATASVERSQPFYIGNLHSFESSTTAAFQGYISNLRILKGTAQYTSTFTPPTSPLTAITNTSLLLNFTNGSIIDSTAKNNLETVGDAQISTSVKKFGTGSLKFDGTGDALVIPKSSPFDFGTGDFTIEAWVYPTATGGVKMIVDSRASDALEAYCFNIITTEKLDFIYSSSRITSTGSIAQNAWTHVAVVRSSGTIKLYINGTVDGSATYSSAINAQQAIAIGGGRSTGGSGVTGYYFNGYIDDLRITKGVARYTSNFTPPSAQLPAR